jgi:type I restriction enzyme S subunit
MSGMQLPNISLLKPYPKYKDSGQAWIGQVPEHWEIQRLKYLLHEVDIRSTDGKEQLLRVSQFSGVTERKSIDGSRPT